MVAACYRRSGNYQSALNSYAKTHKRFPENTECLKFLIRLCDDMGLPEAKDYTDKLRRIEKTRELNNQRKELRSSSRTSKRSAASSREGSASSNSSGYVTESSRMNGNHHHHNRKTSGLDISGSSDYLNASNNRNDFIVDDMELNERPTTSRRRKALDEDHFEGDEVDAILPE